MADPDKQLAHVAKRFSLVGVLLAHILADGLLCGAAAALAYMFEHYVFEPFAVQGLDAYVVVAMRILTGVGLVVTVATYVVADIITVIRQVYRRYKDEKS